jgi:hypothetical protein
MELVKVLLRAVSATSPHTHVSTHAPLPTNIPPSLNAAQTLTYVTKDGGGPEGKGSPEPTSGKSLSYCVMFVSGFQ